MKNLLYLTFLFLLVACGGNDDQPTPTPVVSTTPDPTPEISEDPDLVILFVGNSLTYYNNMPSMVEDIGIENGLNIETDCLCSPNYWFDNHWVEPDLARLLRSGKYDLAILQSGSAWRDNDADILFEYGKLITDLAKENDVRTGFFQVWPSVEGYFAFDKVIRNYAGVASSTDSELYQVGRVWKGYMDEVENEALYLGDGIHPSRKGSFLSAWVIFHTLFPRQDMEYRRAFSKHIDEASLNQITTIFKRYH